jgi:hypothetical protein
MSCLKNALAALSNKTAASIEQQFISSRSGQLQDKIFNPINLSPFLLVAIKAPTCVFIPVLP